MSFIVTHDPKELADQIERGYVPRGHEVAMIVAALRAPRTEVARRQVPPELYDGMAVYVELRIEKTETIRPQMVADVLDALMRLIRKRWKAEAAVSPLVRK